MSRSRTRATVLSGLACATALAAAACPPIDYLSSRADESPGARDAGEGGALIDSGDAGCPSARPPPITPGMPSGATGPTLVFAVRSLGFSAPDGGALGYDLDRTCTCQDPAAKPSCKAPTATESCDGPEGRDAVSESLLSLVTDDPNSAIRSGSRTTLFQVVGWSGAPDDAEVVVQGYPSAGIWATNAEGTAFADDGGVLEDGGRARSISPQWDGNDRWTVDSEGKPAGSPVFVTSGYVRDNVLVAAVPEPNRVPGELVGPGVLKGVELRDAVLTGRIVKGADGRYTIENGIVAGRVEARVLAGITAVQKRDGGFVCEPLPAAVAIAYVARVCDARDIRAQATDDGKDLPCDGLSFAVSFTAAEAKEGLRRTPEIPSCTPEPRPCP